MSDIHQSPYYANFMQNIGWIVESVENENIFIKKFPFIGSIIKLQRPNHIPSIEKLQRLKKEYRAISFTIEPNSYDSNHQAIEQLNNSLKVAKNPYLPTKTIYIDLTCGEEELFNRFSQTTRHAVRKAQKNGIEIIDVNIIDEFITLKNKTVGLLGFLTTNTVKPLWEAFNPENISILLAKHNNTVCAGILILFHEQTAHYWIAAATNEGKKLFAPTLLVWEALKLAQQKKCTIFDFDGIFDERYPNLNKNWQGFTKFKQGFGGEEIYFSQAVTV